MIDLLWVSGQNFDGVLKSIQSGVQSLSFFSDSLWLSQLFGKSFILVDLSVELELESLLGCLDQEISNSFGNRVSHVSHHQLEKSVDSCSDFLHEQVVALFALESTLDNVGFFSRLSGHLSVLGLRSGDNIGSVGQVVCIIGEEVVLF
jgi:hypothetical protein